MEADVELALDAEGTILAVRARSSPTSAAAVAGHGHPAAHRRMLMCGVYDPAAEVQVSRPSPTRCRRARTAAPGARRATIVERNDDAAQTLGTSTRRAAAP